LLYANAILLLLKLLKKYTIMITSLLKTNNPMSYLLCLGILLFSIVATNAQTISGTYNIGANQNSPHYTTITSAITDIITKQVNGDITLELQADYASTSETFPITLKPFTSTGGSWTITIKPAAGVETSIKGSNASAIIKFANNSANYIIDGSNNGSTSRNLFINNTSTATSSVVWFEGTTANQGVQNSAIKNTKIKGGSASATLAVLVGGSTVSTTANGNGHNNLLISNNLIYNSYYALLMRGTSSTVKIKNIKVEANEIGTDSSAFYNQYYGIYTMNTDSVTIKQNHIYNLRTSSSQTVNAIYVYDNATNTTISSNVINGIYATSSGGYGAYGIHIASTTGINNTVIVNNSIYDLITSNYSLTSSTYNAFGIRLVGGNNTKIYFNSVNLYGQPTTGTSASTSAALLVLSTTYTGLDIRNNIFSNSMTGAVSGSKHYAYWTTLTSPSNIALFDYNDFYVSGTYGILMNNNGTAVTTLAALKTATAANSNSVNVDPQFNTNSNLIPLLGSPVLNIGTALIDFTTDQLGATRSATPSLGGYETGGDFSGPVISYAKIINQTSTANYSTSSFANITDVSGVDINSGNKPRMYFKKHSDANAFGGNTSADNGWKWVESVSSSSPFDFVVDYSLLYGGAAAGGDSIKYFVVAQDVLGKVGVSSTTGFSATSVSSITSAPISLDAYVIVSPPMAGTYTVGTGGIYTNLNNAATDITLRGLQGNVTLEILSSITEPAPVIIPQWTEVNGTGYQLNIIPSSTNLAGDTIYATANSRGVIELNGADRVTIDGTINGSGNYLTIVNNSTTATHYGIRIMSLGTGIGATDNKITNVNIRLNNQSANTTRAITAEGNNNHNLQLLNNNISRTGCGIYVSATTAGTGNHNGLVISGNTIGGTTTLDYVSVTGILLSSTPEAQVTKNHIYNIINTLSAYGVYAIYLDQHTNKTTISQNNIHDITSSYYYTYTYYGVYEEASPVAGIRLNSSTNADSILITNNVIFRIANASYSATDTYSTRENPFGITINGGMRHQIIHNSIYLHGGALIPSTGGFSAPVGPTLSAALMIYSAATNLTIQNNIFANGFIGKTGSKSYAIYASTGSTFVTINNNNYDNNGAGTFGIIGYKGTDAATLSAWRTITTQDNASFANTSGFTSNNDLTINTGATSSPLESGAAVIAGLNDFNGDPRPKVTPTTYGGNTLPDIGAYEFDGAPAVPMSYTSSTVTQITGSAFVATKNQTIVRLEINISGVLAPIQTLTEIFVNGTGTSNFGAIDSVKVYSTGTSSVFSTSKLFGRSNTLGTINGNLDLMPGINYFWVTYDIGSSAVSGDIFDAECPLITLSGFTYSPSVISPSGYKTVSGPMAGVYRIGTTGTNDFSSITGALTDLSFRGVSAAVIFELTDAQYNSSGETFPLTITEFTGASAVNTLTIKPTSGNTTTITGTSTASVFNINGADYVTIDGSNNGTNSQNLTVETGTSSAGISVSSLSAANAASNVTIKNCIVNGNATTVTFSAIHIAGATIGTGVAASSATNILVQNNALNKAQYGVFLNGQSTTLLGTNNIIADNQIGQYGANNGIGLQGIHVENQNGVIVQKNIIRNLNSSTTTSYMAGVYATNVKNSSISANTIDIVTYTSTSTPKLNGIFCSSTIFNTVGNPSANTVYNNMISGMSSSATSTYNNTVGINTENGYGDKFYFNSVNMTGQMGAGTGMSAAFANGNSNILTSAKAIDVRNNIFIMTGSSTAAGKLYATFVYTASTIAASIFDYNNLVSNVTGTGAGYIGGTGTANYTTLTDWKTITVQEANSKNVSVVFSSGSDLHLSGNSIGNFNLAGTPISSILDDIEGQTRDMTFPYMGADESITNPLPVKLIAFTAKLQNEDVLLQWTTASEVNNKGFMIERSEDNKLFGEIAFIKGIGNSNVVNKYIHTDVRSFTNKNTTALYYRLVQIDENGHKTVSKSEIVTKKQLSAKSIEVFPNPFVAEVNISFGSECKIQTIEITDISGRVIMTKVPENNLSNHTLSLDLKDLNTGVYFIKFSGSENKTVKLIKTN
jgi:hypothetical protein